MRSAVALLCLAMLGCVNSNVAPYAPSPIPSTTPSELFVEIRPNLSRPVHGLTAVEFTATVTSKGPIPSDFKWYWDLDNDGRIDVFSAGPSPLLIWDVVFPAAGSFTMRVLAVPVPSTGFQAIGGLDYTVY